MRSSVVSPTHPTPGSRGIFRLVSDLGPRNPPPHGENFDRKTHGKPHIPLIFFLAKPPNRPMNPPPIKQFFTSWPYKINAVILTMDGYSDLTLYHLLY